jgi:hypothetical protein
MDRCRAVEHAERIYSSLLWLYPHPFRRRFGPEMKRVFRECCHEQLRTDGSTGFVGLWFHTLKDLVVSAGHQRIRGLVCRIDLNHPVFEIIDSTVMPTIIVSNLIAMGDVVTILFFLGPPGQRISVNDFMLTSGMVSVLFGILGVVSSLTIARLRPTVRLWVKLS